MSTALSFVATVAMGIVFWGLGSVLVLFVLSRFRRRPGAPAENLRFIFVVPALNEGKVIAATLRHLLTLRAHAIVVVDDGSEDDTAAQVRTIRDPRIVLMRRALPEARQGKGAALNAAYQRILRSPKLAKGLDDGDVIVAVVDADGRLAPNALPEAAASFGDAGVGAAQVEVRIRNRRASFWTNMQHFEFIAFGHLYQRGRERTGAVGLGGNGQFVRLSALSALGGQSGTPGPWSSCLTEDMDLGIRLLLAGWRNCFVPTTWVSQQGIPDAKRLLRQRIRWFQGTLQCLRHLPGILASRELPLLARVDLVSIVVTPVVLLAFSPVLVFGLLWFVASVPAVVFGFSSLEPVLPVYLVASIPPMLLTYAYWRHEPETTPSRALLAGNLFTIYGFLWMIVGWAAVVRELRGQRTWARTARVDEPDALIGRAAA